jgi:hypothetical protein
MFGIPGIGHINCSLPPPTYDFLLTPSLSGNFPYSPVAVHESDKDSADLKDLMPDSPPLYTLGASMASWTQSSNS